jgi:deazaflavin-dependent oxidoreductase (nitroreductase family)
VKRRIVHVFQKYLFNPPVKLLFRLGIAPPGYAFLETTGRRSGRPRRTPVGDGREGDTFWIVSEHGRRSGYVRNLEADPHVRVQVREGLRMRWRLGTAHVLEDDDPRERQRTLQRGHPMRALNAAAVRGMGTGLLTVRIDLEPR